MVHSIKIKLPDSFDHENILNSIETVLNQTNFKVDRSNDKLIFERMTAKRGADKFQILVELFQSFTQGTIYIVGDSQQELICKINYFKQLIVSLILGSAICAILSIYAGNFLILFLRIGVPFVMIFLVIGLLTGNSQVDKLLRKAIK